MQILRIVQGRRKRVNIGRLGWHSIHLTKVEAVWVKQLKISDSPSFELHINTTILIV